MVFGETIQQEVYLPIKPDVNLKEGTICTFVGVTVLMTKNKLAYQQGLRWRYVICIQLIHRSLFNSWRNFFFEFTWSHMNT